MSAAELLQWIRSLDPDGSKMSFFAHLVALAAFAFALMQGVASMFRHRRKARYILDPNQ